MPTHKHVFETLFDNFTSPESDQFMNINVQDIYNSAQNDSSLFPTTLNDIYNWKYDTDSISRATERRTLHGARRKLSHRAWKTYAPQSIICCDLAFIRRLTTDQNHKKKYVIVLFLIDAFSRYVHMTVQKDQTSQTTLESFRNALPLLQSGNHLKKYQHCAIDRGSEFRSDFRRYTTIDVFLPANHTLLGRQMDTLNLSSLNSIFFLFFFSENSFQILV